MLRFKPKASEPNGSHHLTHLISHCAHLIFLSFANSRVDYGNQIYTAWLNDMGRNGNLCNGSHPRKRSEKHIQPEYTNGSDSESPIVDGQICSRILELTCTEQQLGVPSCTSLRALHPEYKCQMLSICRILDFVYVFASSTCITNNRQMT